MVQVTVFSGGIIHATCESRTPHSFTAAENTSVLLTQIALRFCLDRTNFAKHKTARGPPEGSSSPFSHYYHFYTQHQTPQHHIPNLSSVHVGQNSSTIALDVSFPHSSMICCRHSAIGDMPTRPEMPVFIFGRHLLPNTLRCRAIPASGRCIRA